METVFKQPPRLVKTHTKDEFDYIHSLNKAEFLGTSNANVAELYPPLTANNHEKNKRWINLL